MDFLQSQLQRARLLFTHGGVRFKLGDESEGTRLIDLLGSHVAAD
jgi:hypothetical protein